MIQTRVKSCRSNHSMGGQRTRTLYLAYLLGTMSQATLIMLHTLLLYVGYIIYFK